MEESEQKYILEMERYLSNKYSLYGFFYDSEKMYLGIGEREKGGENFAVRNTFDTIYRFFKYVDFHMSREPVFVVDESQHEYIILGGVECKIVKFYEGEENTMKESEIIQYLKDNREKGVCFKCMPQEVKEWMVKVKNRIYCMVLDSDGEWDSLENTSDRDYTLDEVGADSVWCLPSDFSARKSKSGWVEFDINSDGYFHTEYLIDHGEGRSSHVCHYTEWNKMLIHYADNSYTNFGGFQYAGLDTWFMSHNVKYGGGGHAEWYRDKDSDNVFPETPVKIRFWKEVK